jgi:peptidoglycan/LPS O-acetylase OafA/YrhL
VHSAWVGELSLVTHPILRLDCCAYGVLLAMIVRGDPNRVRAWFSRWWVGVAAFCLFPLILLGVILMTLLRHAGDQQMLESIYFPDWGTSYYALQFSVIDFVMAVIVVGFSFIEIRLPAMIRGFVTEMSRTSYSLYLIHTLINYFILAWIMTFFGPILGPIAYIALLGGGSWLSYRAIERPFLRVRDLWSEQVRARSPLAESLPSATGSAR